MSGLAALVALAGGGIPGAASDAPVVSFAWERLPDIPVAAERGAIGAGARSSVPWGPSHTLHFSDDGTIRAYHEITDTWTDVGSLPEPLSDVIALRWRGGVVVAGSRAGETRVFFGKPVPPRTSFAAIDAIVFALYFAALIAMGFHLARREKTTRDYFLGGRRIPWWAAGLSIFGTQLSAITYMTIPAKAYATDWVFIAANVCIVLVAPIVVFLYLPFFRRLEITTAYEYLEMRFDAAVRLFGSIAFIAFQFGRMGIVIVLPAMALSAVTGIPFTVSIILVGVISTLYTVLGGIEAVIWTDVIQVGVLLGGAILCLAWVVADAGGIAPVVAAGQAYGKFRAVHWGWDVTAAVLWVAVVGNLFIAIAPYTADQAVIQRYLTTRDERAAARSIWTNAIVTIPSTLVFFGLGTALFAFYRSHPQRLNPALPTDAVLPWFIVEELPAGISGLIIAGIFAATMSTLDSGMNSIATAFVTDIYRRIRRAASDGDCLRVARWLTVAVGALATGAGLVIAGLGDASLWDRFFKIIGLFAGTLSGVFMLGIFTRRASGAGVLVGVAASVAVLAFVQHWTRIHFFLYAAVGTVTCVAVGYLASLLLPPQEKPLGGLTIHTMARGGGRGADPSAG
ncbi:MAG: sodium:solute symporter [Planctomycetes bacterium]|nr:sodium:solute symporter [Planctomycetota bacterium]